MKKMKDIKLKNHLPPLPVLITTDSCADLTKEWCEENGVKVIPFHWSTERCGAQTDPFNLKDTEKHNSADKGMVQTKGSNPFPAALTEHSTTYIDEFVSVSEQFYEGLADGSLTVRTSCINPDEFCEFFTEGAKGLRSSKGLPEGSPVIVVHLSMSSGLSSGTWESVRKGRRLAESEDESLKVIVIDTKAASFTQGLAVKYAAALFKENPPSRKEELEARTKEVESFLSSRLFMTGYLGDLSFLQRTGRTSRTKAWAGKLLGLHPMATYNKETGLVDVIGMTRLPKALKNILSAMEEMMRAELAKASPDAMRCDAHGKGDGFPLVEEIVLGYTGPKAYGKALEFLPCLRAICPEADVSLSCIGNVAGAHMGPETFYVTWGMK